MSWSITEEPSLRGTTVEWLAQDWMIVSRREHLYRCLAQEPGVHLGSVPVPWWESAASRLRPLQRLLRAMVYNVVVRHDESLLVTYGRGVWLHRGGRFEALHGLARPCRVLRGGVAVDGAGRAFFGEYLTNRSRTAMRVYCLEPGSSRAEVVHEFPAGSVRHIHGIYHDPYSGALWCLTGDFGAECRMLTTRDSFQSLDMVGAGDESWRCVSLLFTASHVYYATDAELETNRVYRIDRSSGRREELGELDGPTYYSRACGGDLFFAVTAELCPSQQGRAASLWRLDPSGELQRLAGFEKDRLPVGLFLPGTLHFPTGPGRADEFYFHGVGLRGADGRTFRVHRSA